MVTFLKHTVCLQRRKKWASHLKHYHLWQKLYSSHRWCDSVPLPFFLICGSRSLFLFLAIFLFITLSLFLAIFSPPLSQILFLPSSLDTGLHSVALSSLRPLYYSTDTFHLLANIPSRRATVPPSALPIFNWWWDEMSGGKRELLKVLARFSQLYSTFCQSWKVLPFSYHTRLQLKTFFPTQNFLQTLDYIKVNSVSICYFKLTLNGTFREKQLTL